MRHWEWLPPKFRLFVLLLALAPGLAGCGLGEATTPNPPTGIPADRSVGMVRPVPAPIPHSLEQRQECFTCHAIGAVDAPPVPADHEQDVTLCTTCHAVWLAPDIAAAAPPGVPHEVEGREDCLVCHKVGTADAPRVPENHNGLTSDICQTCHTRQVEIAGGSDGEEQEPMAEIPPIPHGLEGFSACTGCHAEGGPGIPRFPEDHEGRTDDLCSACHEPAVEAPMTTPTPEPTEAPSVATPTPEPAASPTEVARSTAGDVANGEALFGGRCAPCHGAEGEGTSIAPEAINDASLLGELTDEDLRTVIREGVGDRMPASPNLSDQEVLDIIAFLRSWQ
ncbi:MAG: cytochrome c [Anaerolineae bacterium]|nr:cytochrome c [Anaerolineae bacterium]